MALTAGDGRTFDHYARLAQRLVDVPTAAVSIADDDRLRLPGVAGLVGTDGEIRAMPLSHSLCQYVVAGGRPVAISDTRLDPRVAQHLAILELGVLAYIGFPIVDAEARTRGALCAIDVRPRAWTAQEQATMIDLAQACSAELQQSMAMARESESLARTLVGAAPVAMAFFDDRQQLAWANGPAERLLLAPRLASGDVTPATGGHLVVRALAGELTEQAMEWIGDAGRQVAVVASSRRLHHPDGRPQGTLVVAQDVTELARALSLNDEFVATVSHELRTPLTTIQGYLEVLGDELSGPAGEPSPLQPILDRMDRAGHNLRDRIEDLLDVAARRRSLHLQPLDLAGVARRIPGTFGEQARARTLDLVVAADTPHWAVVDARRIEQAVENLVSNALKYTPAGGRVEVSVCGREEGVDVVVADTGIGMSPHEVDHACDRFWRAETARAMPVQGFGLGLDLVHQVATEHRGGVHIRSAPDRGTTVTLSLPRSPLGETAAAGPVLAAVPA